MKSSLLAQDHTLSTQKSRPWMKVSLTIFALIGACVLACALFNDQDDGLEELVQMNQEFTGSVQYLSDEAQGNMSEIEDIIVDLKARAKDKLNRTGDGLKRGVNAVNKNADWSKRVERNIVNPSSLLHAINKAKDGINRNLIHGNGGGNIKIDIYRAKYSMRSNYSKYAKIVKDVNALISDDIKSSKKIIHTLGLRKSYQNSKRLNPSLDVDLWDKTSTDMLHLLQRQLKELTRIVKDLNSLQREAASFTHKFEQDVMKFRRQPRDHFGSFDFVNDMRNSFAGLRDQSKKLLHSATQTMDSTKDVKNTISTRAHDLKNSFNRQEIEFHLDDEMFSSELGMSLHRSLDRLVSKCNKVSKELSGKWHQIQHAIRGVNGSSDRVLIMYEHDNYHGWQMTQRGSANISQVRHNDGVSSVKIPDHCCATLYEHDKYNGESITFCGPHQYGSMPRGWNDKISSLKQQCW